MKANQEFSQDAHGTLAKPQLDEFTVNESECSLASMPLSRSLEGSRKARDSEISGFSQQEARRLTASLPFPGLVEFFI